MSYTVNISTLGLTSSLKMPALSLKTALQSGAFTVAVHYGLWAILVD